MVRGVRFTNYQYRSISTYEDLKKYLLILLILCFVNLLLFFIGLI